MIRRASRRPLTTRMLLGLVWIVCVIFAAIGARAAAKGELYRNRSILRVVN
ncbi:hypothetical protein [Microbacterium sp. CIAB417]|uniref:hypothetical protein n=1 Tax=Microbacterium sp. CIAB417 TaxID=2860287 RepID=UPI001FAD32E8|nr:hypothetical protein [Microbacterium sp. CIAB417]